MTLSDHRLDRTLFECLSEREALKDQVVRGPPPPISLNDKMNVFAKGKPLRSAGSPPVVNSRSLRRTGDKDGERKGRGDRERDRDRGRSRDRDHDGERERRERDEGRATRR